MNNFGISSECIPFPESITVNLMTPFALGSAKNFIGLFTNELVLYDDKLNYSLVSLEKLISFSRIFSSSLKGVGSKSEFSTILYSLGNQQTLMLILPLSVNLVALPTKFNNIYERRYSSMLICLGKALSTII